MADAIPGRTLAMAHDADLNEVLAYKVGREEYAIDILKVQEIRGYESPTRIANAPACVMGVVNLRGVIVPIVDLRIRLGVEDVRYDELTVVIILDVAHRVVGMVVDSVSDVLALRASQVRPAPAFNSMVDAGHVTGLASLGEGCDARMLILIDIERLMSGTDMGLAAASEAPAQA